MAGSISRRDVIGGIAAGAWAGIGFGRAFGQARPRVVVVGAGAGGASVARELAQAAAGGIEIVLVDPKDAFTTCFHSNLYLGGIRDFGSITHDHRGLGTLGIEHVRQAATAIDRDRRTVRLADGAVLQYDHLVLAPGIDILFDRIEGYSPEAARIMPHAWQGGEQTLLLHDQLHALEDGALVVMVSPPEPYRCPPGPYERASMMAHVLKTREHRRSRIIILDAKESFSKQALFQEGWERHYPGMIEWQDPLMHGGIGAVDAATLTVATGLADYAADLVNVIPPQAAGVIARDAGLADASGYCPVRAESMRSTMDERITLVGDATVAGDMPKSAYSANSQARVAASAILAELAGGQEVEPTYFNTCWSLIAPEDAVKVGGRYVAQEGRITAIETFVSQPGEDARTRRRTQAENMGWYEGIIETVFGAT